MFDTLLVSFPGTSILTGTIIYGIKQTHGHLNYSFGLAIAAGMLALLAVILACYGFLADFTTKESAFHNEYEVVE